MVMRGSGSLPSGSRTGPSGALRIRSQSRRSRFAPAPWQGSDGVVPRAPFACGPHPATTAPSHSNPSARAIVFIGRTVARPPRRRAGSVADHRGDDDRGCSGPVDGARAISTCVKERFAEQLVKRPIGITVQVDGDGGACTLACRYRVAGARWAPSYVARLGDGETVTTPAAAKVRRSSSASRIASGPTPRATTPPAIAPTTKSSAGSAKTRSTVYAATSRDVVLRPTREISPWTKSSRWRSVRSSRTSRR